MPTSRHLRWLSTNHSQRSSTSSLALSAVFSNNSSYGTPRSSLGNGTSLTQLPEGIACNDEYKHEHWCTYGEHSKPTDTCEGWKRHEREHETGYMCMPNGPVEHTEHGPICALCGEEDPDADHMTRHNISICFGKFKAPLKKSRRTDMIKHLAQHHVHSEDAAVLAEQWRYDSQKKYFSCGLCVGIFFSIKERSNHIDNEHWRHGQNMGSWELSNLIRGLLLEPKVQAAWRVLLTSHHDLVESNLRWEMPLAEGLQVRLEKGEESGPVLAKAALEHSNYERIRPHQDVLMATLGREEMNHGLVSGAHRSLAAGTAVPSSNSTDQSFHNHKQSRTPLSRPLTGSLSSSNVEISSAGIQNLQCDPLLYPSLLFGAPFQPDDLCNDHFLPSGPLMDANISDIPLQVPTYACSAEWSSMDTNQPPDDHPRLQGHLSESGALLIAQMSSPRHGQPAIHRAIDEQRPVMDSRNKNDNSNVGRLPTSNFFHGCTAQLSNHEYGFNFRKKPLPPIPLPNIPENASRVAEHRSSTPMDLGAG